MASSGEGTASTSQKSYHINMRSIITFSLLTCARALNAQNVPEHAKVTSENINITLHRPNYIAPVGDPVCSTSTSTTTIGECSFKIKTTIYCSSNDLWGGVDVTEKNSGVTANSCETGLCTTHCDGETDCTNKMTSLAMDTIAWMYTFPLGSTTGEVRAGVCSCGTQTTMAAGESFEVGLCVAFDDGDALLASDVTLKTYAIGDGSPYHVGYVYNYNCNANGFGNDTASCATAVGTLATKNALSAPTTMSGTGGVYVENPYNDDDGSSNPFANDMRAACPYGSSAQKVAYYNDEGNDEMYFYLCTIDGVSSDPTGGFGGIYQTTMPYPQDDDVSNPDEWITDDKFAETNPWSGGLSCPDGFKNQSFRIELGGEYDDDDRRRLSNSSSDSSRRPSSEGDGKQGFIHVCGGESGPAGLIAGGFQTCAADRVCSDPNMYTGSATCPDGYTGVKVFEAKCPYLEDRDDDRRRLGSARSSSGSSDESAIYLCFSDESAAATAVSSPQQ